MTTILLIFFEILEFIMFVQVISLFWIWICGWVVWIIYFIYSLEGSYQTLLELPEEITKSTRTAVVIPAFFHTGWTIANGTLQEQVNSVIDRIPFSMSDLLTCVKIHKCSANKKGLFTHVPNDASIESSYMFLKSGSMIKWKESMLITTTMRVGRMIYKNRNIFSIPNI